jgi:hypothetical protein
MGAQYRCNQLCDTTDSDKKSAFGGSATSPDTVTYLGYIVYTFVADDTFKRKGSTTYYNYNASVDVDWDKRALQDYLIEHNGAAWLDMEIVQYGKK